MLALLLVQCGGQNADVPPSALQVSGARKAIVWTVRIGGLLHFSTLRPGALLGTYIAQYLVHSSMFHSATAGIEAQMQFLFDDEFEKTESFAILEDLGVILQVDIPDMLNRSVSRAQSFDTYVENLTNFMERSAVHVAQLEQELEEISDERREARRVASDTQRELNDALRDQDYSTASGLQQRLILAQGDLAEVEAREDEKRDVIRLFENLLDVGEERLNAMESNRQALLAGIKVTELPGVDELGILEQGSRRGRSRNSDSIFD